MVASVELDEFDRRILRALQANADHSMADLGGLIGLSHTPCWRRLKRLEAEGVIQKKVTLLDPSNLDLDVIVHAQVRMKDHQPNVLEAFEAQIQTLPHVLECYALSGDYDYGLKIVVKSVEHYERLLKRNLLPLPNVASINSTFALRQVKYSTQLPL
ncbi:Lrp/AsnC family transcriptional regulator [Marinimicrobium sp. ABcell2]|uniref:Lrp/AsnC family transcriptional regulator n=1 Tax=Marinimicrobium sp. ABcell2 TaxID=3069751 RepID=UPI0027B60BFD|nr:Lrp/AsnC family transcriptional regulator [Marinimicrobium sp. ABcell2]MDQ2077167.1 Lrp/AsnC family transcriptional regulator [Marinimicrobium sp. ABcell2]